VDGIEIRRATEADLRAAAALRWAWVVEGKGATPDGDRDDFVEHFVGWALSSRTHTCFVAVAAGADSDEGVVGMAWLAINERVPSPRAFDRRNGDVQSVFVAPAHRRRGVASALIVAISDAARQSGAERLTVHSSAEAVNTYARAGFQSSEALRHQILTAL